ncbi:Zinc ribbon domain protein [Gemmata obscuriglobus]|nr:Zinc ribbon domain protein [Gemmata obscuriglobus]VTS08069.1 Protein containing Regulatory protein, FmdB, putative domain protein OS=Rhodopirellula baltica SWK14 GN=RBSWK_03583 PE=4 SV=1: Zn-ribbon_8 [Gemmata obscuriglobus UQM 2246]
MPLYEYKCRNCEHGFEALTSSRTAVAVTCPKCEGKELDQLIGLPALGRVSEGAPATNCRGDGPPCGASWCGRKNA